MDNLQYFRFWCQKVLPLVYDDSLSYYEVLCKVQDYINKLIEQDKEFAGEISGLDKDVATIMEWIREHSGDEPPVRKYLFIGDSYAASQYANWPTRIGQLLGLTADQDYWIVSASGSGFASGTWLSRLQTWAAANPDKLNQITDIICAGGINDAASAYFANLNSALEAFAAYTKTAFPNATVKIAYIGACWYDSATYADRPLYNQIGVINAYSRVGKYGMKYLPGCEMVMHNTTYFVSDRIHPNSYGADAIVAALYDAITNGSALVTGRGVVSLDAIDDDGYPVFSGVTAGIQYVQGNTVVLNAGIQLDSVSGLTIGNTETVIGEMELPFTTQMTTLKVPCMLRVGSVYSEHEATIRVYQGRLYIRIQEQDPNDASQWLTFTPNRLSINFSKAGNGHEF